MLPATIRSIYPNAPGDIWLNVDSGLGQISFNEPGSIGFAAVIHEIGHTLGLKHPHDDGGTGHPTFAAAGEKALDVDWATVMSYNESNPQVLGYWHPATPMILDVIAIQAIYGANLTNHAGNDTYSLTANNVYQTIFDPSGTDTLDASSSSYGWNINLGVSGANGYHPYNIGLASPTNGTSEPSSLYWLYGQFERVIGSKFDDVIFGSEQTDYIVGNGGNDILEGKGGNDVFFGLSGRTAIYGGDGYDTISTGLASGQTIFAKLRTDSVLILESTGNFTLARNVESISYTDKNIDVNSAPVFSGLDSVLAQIYVAAFRRAPETSGFNYWIGQEKSFGVNKVADTIFSLDIVKALYPISMTNTQFVNAIYSNVFDRAPDAAGLVYWTSALGKESRGQLVIEMTNAALSVPDGTDGKDFFQNRLDWSLYAVAYQSVSKELPTAYLSTLTKGITADVSTLIGIIGQAESGHFI